MVLFQCFKWLLQVTEMAGMNTITVRILPLDSSEYAVLVDFVLTVADATTEVRFVPFSFEEATHSLFRKGWFTCVP